jgi:hypothetical protein
MFTKIKGFVVASLTALVSVSASAAIDTTALQTEATAFQTDALAVAAIIGLAFMSAAFGFVIYKWIRGAIFG